MTARIAALQEEPELEAVEGIADALPESVDSDPRVSPETMRDILLGAAGLSPDRLPMLSAISERLAVLCSESLAVISATKPRFLAGATTSGRIGDVFDTRGEGGVVGLFHVPAWDCQIAVVFDRAFVLSLVELLFGADGGEPICEGDFDFSNIELRVARAAFEQFARGLKGAFALVTDLDVEFIRTETRMEDAIIGRRHALALVTQVSLQAFERGGEMYLVIPQAALMPLRQALAATPPGDAPPHDPSWSRLIRSEVQWTEVEVSAVLDQCQMTLGEIAALQVGQVIPLAAGALARMKVGTPEQALFWCQLGQADGSYVLKVEDTVDQRREFVDDIFPR